MYGTIFVSEMLNTFEETFEVTKMRTFKHQPFFIVPGGGVGAYSWYFTVVIFNDLTICVGVTFSDIPRYIF